MSLMACFCAVLFPLDVLDEIWDLVESVSEGFPTYSSDSSSSSSLLDINSNMFYVLLQGQQMCNNDMFLK